MDVPRFLPKGTNLFSFGGRNGRGYWRSQCYLDPIDAVAHDIFERPVIANLNKSFYMVTVSLAVDVQLGRPLTKEEIVPDMLEDAPPDRAPLSPIITPNVPGLQVFWLHDNSFPYISYPDSMVAVKISKHPVDPNYRVYRESLMANAGVWWVAGSPKPMPKLSHPTELLAYGTFLDRLFKEAESSSVESVFGREFGFKNIPPPRLENPIRALDAQSSKSRYGLHNGRMVFYKQLNKYKALREALLIRYLNVVLPGHTPLLLDFYFKPEYGSDPGVGTIVLEYIADTTDVRNLGRSVRHFIAYERRLIELTERERLAGVYARDMHGGNFLLKLPIDNDNPVMYRIDYGEESCFLTSPIPQTYQCNASRDRLYTGLMDKYGDVLNRTDELLKQTQLAEDRALLEDFMREIVERNPAYFDIVD